MPNAPVRRPFCGLQALARRSLQWPVVVRRTQSPARAGNGVPHFGGRHETCLSRLLIKAEHAAPRRSVGVSTSMAVFDATKLAHFRTTIA
jgi:hypothetical protein